MAGWNNDGGNGRCDGDSDDESHLMNIQIFAVDNKTSQKPLTAQSHGKPSNRSRRENHNDFPKDTGRHCGRTGAKPCTDRKLASTRCEDVIAEGIQAHCSQNDD